MKFVLLISDSQKSRLYADGECVASWDKMDSMKHIKSQVALRVEAAGGTTYEERTIEGFLPDTLPDDDDIGEDDIGQVVDINEEDEPADESEDGVEGNTATTTYATGPGEPELLS